MNEPVAWMVDGVLFNSLGAALNISFDIEQPCIPLYTHPAKPLSNVVVASATCSCGKVMEVTNLQEAKTLTEDTECQYCKQGCIRCDARKLLTDEEITQVFDECYPNNADGDVVTLIDFARAILRKAQEK